MDSQYAARISLPENPFLTKATASVLANTTQVRRDDWRIFVDHQGTLADLCDGYFQKLCHDLHGSTGTSGAHLSFRRNWATLPRSSQRMALQSCPPMSKMIRAVGKKKWAPRAWHPISVMVLLAKGTLTRPYPVPTTYWTWSWVSPASAIVNSHLALLVEFGELESVLILENASIWSSARTTA